METENQFPDEFYRERRVWPFSKMPEGDSRHYDDYSEYRSALAAAHMVGKRKGWKFRGKWIAAKDEKPAYGLIARMQ